MQVLKSSKHRCQCFSKESSSFLYGLRREAPSTERVLLERLLNVLSRAAAQQGKNPQRLWAESERPEWWKLVTTLQWKNPREHPKDNKDILKKKIDILERELRNRKLLTKELQDELEIHRGGKKVDLELKSDFEAVIAKASGLHYMLSKVKTKMGQSRVMTDKLAKYISETKACLEKSLKVVRGMYTQVEDRERRKTSLWEKMGVSKQERAETSEDLESEDLEMDFDLTSEDVAPFPLDPFSPPSPFSPHPVSPLEMSEVSSPRSQKVSEPTIAQTVQQDIPQQRLSISPRLPASTQRMSLPLQSSVSQPSSPLSAFESQQVSQGHATGPPAKKSRRRSADDAGIDDPDQKFLKPHGIILQPQVMNHDAGIDDPDQKFLKPRGIILQPQVMNPVMEDVDVEIMGYSISSGATISGLSSESSAILSDAGAESKRLSESEAHRRGEDRRYRRTRDHSLSLGGKEKQSTRPTVHVEHKRYFSHPTSSYIQFAVSPVTIDVPPAVKHEEEWRSLRERNIGRVVSSFRSISHPSSTATTLPTDDLVVDSPKLEVNESELENVVDILEHSETPTISMYTEPDVRAMDQLAEMTVNLSCEDLTATVIEPFMGNLREGGSASGPDRPYRRPAATSVSRSPDENQSLSQAIGSLGGYFPR